MADCKAVGLGAPPASSDAPVLADSCLHLKPTGVSLDLSGKACIRRRRRTGRTGGLGSGSLRESTNTSDLRTVLVTRSGGVLNVNPGRAPTGQMNPTAGADPLSILAYVQYNPGLSNPSHPAFTGGFFDDVIGVQFYYADRSGSPAGTGLYSQSASQVGGTGSGMMGLTRPDRCWFYFGEKIANTTGDDYDEPAGTLEPSTDVTDEPTPADPPAAPGEGSCGFSLTDPGSWLEGGMCTLANAIGGVIELLAKILRALGNLPGALADAITGAFEFLLVPDPDLIEERWDAAMAAWEDAGPGPWVDELSGLVPDGAATAPGFTACFRCLLARMTWCWISGQPARGRCSRRLGWCGWR